MNSSKRERREDQLMKKAEKLAEYASEIVMQSDTQMLIDGHPYVLVKNYRDGFQTDKLKERFSQILTKYDYIVGDWGYDQLRLRGFYESGSKKGTPSQNIDRLMDYLYENCNFGCAYFVLHNLDVQKPTPVPKEDRRKNRVSSKQRKRKRQRQNNVYEEKVYEVHSRKPNRNSDKRNKMKAKTVGKNSRSRHFTIRQKD
ncbi:YutD family protein [Ligilactobacillus ruminis]|uniref:YutD family protein n=2 Tax=Ligilactobacillus ruminis TaxID=1623 RepID=A0AAQ2XKJ2_9LACO|nr:YutD family protein [Ligilactobacillus ruminis]MCI5767436.1 YutD family protein [Ligilactobacillus ruminis]MDD5958766.1 YutD family protein [Ligilactobacillus ruminis]MDD6170951.1 YutD family protein [Ligilactobacillus ruminis]NME32900.1 YutD family protein [Ligilactobacillus ruminis]WDC82204.1 YutD family protein [Ligilactobacillus ruminis]